ncbi:hypothetical protein D7X33_07710 [Butyricicoccus sp. 1XD8-22]|nr:hypothetical protein D7X33_07710 [Butyricicoccus sp. 1XD8-22]
MACALRHTGQLDPAARIAAQVQTEGWVGSHGLLTKGYPHSPAQRAHGVQSGPAHSRRLLQQGPVRSKPAGFKRDAQR